MHIRKLNETQEIKCKQFRDIKKTIHTMSLKFIKGEKINRSHENEELDKRS